MAVGTTSTRTRRAILVAAVGGLIAAAGSVIGRAAPARAANGDPILAGRTAVAHDTTEITTSQGDALSAATPDEGGVGVTGIATAYSDSGSATGVLGRTNSGFGAGVRGSAESYSGAGTGVSGTSFGDWGIGVSGTASAKTGFTKGVAGRCDSIDGVGVYGSADADHGFGTGVLGHSESGRGVGVSGWSVGTAGKFRSTSGTALVAEVDGPEQVGLEAFGKVRLPGRSGRVIVPAGASTVTVRVTGGLAGSPLCFATLMAYRAGVSVAAVEPGTAATGVLTVHLGQTVAEDTPLAWLVLD